MYNPGTLATLGTQDTGRTQKKTEKHRKLKRWASHAPPKTGGGDPGACEG